MPKKPRNYRPQVRTRIKETLPPSETPEAEVNSDPEAVLARLSDLFELGAVARGETPSSFTGSMAATLQSGNRLIASDSDFDADELLSMMPDLVVAIRAAAEQLADEGFDRINSHEILPRLDAIKLFERAATKGQVGMKLAMDFINNRPDEEMDIEAIEALNGLQHTAYMRLLRVFMLSKRMSRIMRESDIDLSIYDDYRQGAIAALEREMENNPTTVRRDTSRSLKYLFSDEVSGMLDYFGYLEQSDHTAALHAEHRLEFPLQELDFTILPAGTGLRDITEAISNRLNEREKARVDLDRVNVLAAIRDEIGPERCYFAHGKRSERQMIDAETDTAIDEDYIVLVIQNLDEHGLTVSEDALAISPIANKHAAYLVRQDAAAGNWRELLSLPKQDSRYYGARDLRFTGSTGRTPYAMMEEKVKALLSCQPDDFHNKLRMRGDGTYRLENFERELGHAASVLVATSERA